MSIWSEATSACSRQRIARSGRCRSPPDGGRAQAVAAGAPVRCRLGVSASGWAGATGPGYRLEQRGEAGRAHPFPLSRPAPYVCEFFGHERGLAARNSSGTRRCRRSGVMPTSPQAIRRPWWPGWPTPCLAAPYLPPAHARRSPPPPDPSRSGCEDKRLCRSEVTRGSMPTDALVGTLPGRPPLIYETPHPSPGTRWPRPPRPAPATTRPWRTPGVARPVHRL